MHDFVDLYTTVDSKQEICMLDGHTSAVNIVALMYVAMMIAVVCRQ